MAEVVDQYRILGDASDANSTLAEFRRNIASTYELAYDKAGQFTAVVDSGAAAMKKKRIAAQTLTLGLYQLGSTMAVTGGRAGMLVNAFAEIAALMTRGGALALGIGGITLAMSAGLKIWELYNAQSIEAAKNFETLTTKMIAAYAAATSVGRAADEMMMKLRFGEQAGLVRIGAGKAETEATIGSTQRELAALRSRRASVANTQIIGPTEGRGAGFAMPNPEAVALEEQIKLKEELLDVSQRNLLTINAALASEEKMVGAIQKTANAKKAEDFSTWDIREGEKGASGLQKAIDDKYASEIQGLADYINAYSAMMLNMRASEDAAYEAWRAELTRRAEAQHKAEEEALKASIDKKVQLTQMMTTGLVMDSIGGYEQRIEEDARYQDEISQAQREGNRERVALLKAERAGRASLAKTIMQDFLLSQGKQLIAMGIGDVAKGTGMMLKGAATKDPIAVAAGGKLAAWGFGEVAGGGVMVGGGLAMVGGGSAGGGSAGAGGAATNERGGPEGSGDRGVTIYVLGAMTNEDQAVLIERGLRDARMRGF